MTMMTATYPLPRIDSQHTSETAVQSRPWSFWATLGWFAAAVATYIAVSFLCGFGYALWMTIAHPGVAIDFDSPTLQYLAMALSMPAAALLLMLAARRAGPTAFRYVGLTMPAWRHFLVGLGLLAVVWCLAEVFFRLFPAYDQSPELIRDYRAILGNPAALALYWITLTVTAPVFEEIIFRGFLMRGWSETRLGSVGAILLSSLVFAVVHLQYNVPTMAMVFGLGLVFGLMRWRSGSTTVAIMLHATWNLSCGLWFAWQA
jgi:membrane protease YdiL (CAAX protease family)